MVHSRSLVQLVDAWFLRSATWKAAGKAPTNADPRPVFSTALNFNLSKKAKLAVIGDYPKTDFLAVLANHYTAHPVGSRTFPASLNDATFKTKLLRFVNNGSWGHGAHDSSGGFTHLSSRYEFFKDLEVDELVSDFIADRSYNSNVKYDRGKVEKLIHGLNLIGLQGQFITTLSNGQFRRARIAKELYAEPALLCIDDPFLGLDPVATQTVNHVLQKTSCDEDIKTTVVVGLRSQDDVPEWIEDVVIVNDIGIIKQGKRADLLADLKKLKSDFAEKHELLEQKITNNITSSAIFSKGNNNPLNHTPIIEMKNTNIMYKGVPIIKDLTWTVKAGEKWHIRGRNGSGKTTLLSLITLDHPQSWNRSISVFGVERKPGKVNYFDTNKYIGFTSPELHALYPRHHTLFQTISTGYIVGSYIPPTVEQLGADKVKKIRDYMKLVGLDGQEELEFGDVHVSTQKLVLLLRAIINDPKILILDEALSSMTDDDLIKGKCLIDRLNTTCLVIGHVDNEVPRCDRYILVNGARKGIYEIGDV